MKNLKGVLFLIGSLISFVGSFHLGWWFVLYCFLTAPKFTITERHKSRVETTTYRLIGDEQLWRANFSIIFLIGLWFGIKVIFS